MTKYKILKNDSIYYDGVTLYRIQSRCDFDDVQFGDIGGYIEKEYNLSHSGTAWVYDNAKVFGRYTTVYDNAKIRGHAIVKNGAKIFENAVVKDKAQVFSAAKIHGNSRIYKRGRIYSNVNIFGKAKVKGELFRSNGIEISKGTFPGLDDIFIFYIEDFLKKALIFFGILILFAYFALLIFAFIKVVS